MSPYPIKRWNIPLTVSQYWAAAGNMATLQYYTLYKHIIFSRPRFSLVLFGLVWSRWLVCLCLKITDSSSTRILESLVPKVPILATRGQKHHFWRRKNTTFYPWQLQRWFKSMKWVSTLCWLSPSPCQLKSALLGELYYTIEPALSVFSVNSLFLWIIY